MSDTQVEDIRDKIFDNESKLARVEAILERVAVNQDKMADSMGQISASLVKQEVILEKLMTLESNSKGSFERVHLKIDKLEKYVKEIEEKVQYPGEIKVNVIRESRAVEFAK